jgi:TolB protein
LLQFTVDGAGPGDVEKTSGDVSWDLNVASTLPFERVEILVNGNVVWAESGAKQAGVQRLTGRIKAPAGGWIAARVHGGVTRWPAMDSYPFAHTAPVWFGALGSTDPVAARRAAGELLAALTVAEGRVKESYGETPTPVLVGRIREARLKLEAFTR